MKSSSAFVRKLKRRHERTQQQNGRQPSMPPFLFCQLRGRLVAAATLLREVIMGNSLELLLQTINASPFQYYPLAIAMSIIGYALRGIVFTLALLAICAIVAYATLPYRFIEVGADAWMFLRAMHAGAVVTFVFLGLGALLRQARGT